MTTTTDLFLGATPPAAQLTWAWLAHAEPAALRVAAAAFQQVRVPPVNTAVISPAGFDVLVGRPRPRMARLITRERVGMIIVDERDRPVVNLGTPPVLAAKDLARLRGFSGVQVTPTLAVGPVQLAALMAQLLVGGVPVASSALPFSVRKLLGADLANLVEELSPVILADQRLREQWSVRARRCAMLAFTTAGGVLSARPVVAVVVDVSDTPTTRRLLAQISAQTWPALEICLATPRRAADISALTDLLAMPVHVVRHDDLASARHEALGQTTAELATYLSAGLRYGPEHVTDLVLGYGYSRASIVGVLARRTYIEAIDVTVETSDQSGERSAREFTPGTMLTARHDLLQAITHRDGEAQTVLAGSMGAVTVPTTDSYAIHDLSVVVPLPRGQHARLEHALAHATRQWSGTVIESSIEELPGATRDLAYASYFTRVQPRSA